MFGVPGDYVLPVFDEIVRSDLELVVTCNELNAGYAADGYARLRGVGAVAVTYDVGGFSLLNAVAGANAERVPVIVVSGAPRTTAAASRHVLHHSTGDLDVQYRVYREVTAAAVQLTDAAAAPRLIDQAVAACLRERRPCYIEVPLDVAGQQCEPPGDFARATTCEVDAAALDEAVAATAELIAAAAAERRGSGDLPVAAIAGVEAHRLHVAADLQALLEHLGCPFVTTISSKSVLPETHPQFAGVYIGHLGRRRARDVTEGRACCSASGALLSDLDLGLYTAEIDPERLVAAGSRPRACRRSRVRPGAARGVPPRAARGHPGRRRGAGTGGRRAAARGAAARPPAARPDPDRPITVSRFYERMRSFIEPGSLVLADGGRLAALGAPTCRCPSTPPSWPRRSTPPSAGRCRPPSARSAPSRAGRP